MKFLQPNEVKCLITDPQIAESIVILDVRDDDFSDGHIKSCVNIPCYELCSSGSRKMDDFIETHCDRSKTSMVIVHCYLSQQRGPMAATRWVKFRFSFSHGGDAECSNLNITAMHIHLLCLASSLSAVMFIIVFDFTGWQSD